jgi:hypothetical protein
LARAGGNGRIVALCGIIAALLYCAPGGYVLHVDNRESVPYTAVDERLKQRVLRALLRHRLISTVQTATCGLNIMEIDRFYLVEVWPDGILMQNSFGIRLTKPFMSPAGKYTDCKKGSDADSCFRTKGN